MIFEAMAKGLIIVASKVGGIPDVIRTMENGILVAPYNANEIAEALTLLSGNGTLSKKLSERGYDCVEENTIEKQATRIADEIHRMKRKTKWS